MLTRSRWKPAARRPSPHASRRPSGWPSVAELGDVAPEEERRRPVGDDAELARDERQLVRGGSVRVTNQPGKPRSAQAQHVGDPLVAAERRDLAEHPVAVGLRVAARGSSRAAAPGGARAGRWAGRARPAARFGTRAQSPSAQTSSVPSTRSVASTRTRPRSSSGSPSSREERVRLHARRPDERRGRDPLAVGRASPPRASSEVERRRDVDLDPALRELPGGVLAEAAAGSRGGSSAPRRRAPSAAARRGAAGRSGARPATRS